MNAVNIEGLMATMSQATLASRPTGNAASQQAPEVSFLEVLQTFAGTVGTPGLQAQNASGATVPGWLSSLMVMLGQTTEQGVTPDPIGEASFATSGVEVSLTDIMAAVQSMVSQDAQAGLALGQNSAKNAAVSAGAPATIGKAETDTETDTTAATLNLIASAMSSSVAATVVTTDTPSGNVTATNATQPAETASLTQTSRAAIAVTANASAETGAATATASQNTPTNAALNPAAALNNATATQAETQPQTQATNTTAQSGTSFAQSLANAAGEAATAKVDSATPNGATATQQHTANTAAPTQAETASSGQPNTVDVPFNVTQPANATAPGSVVQVAQTVATPELPDIPALRQIVESAEIIKQQGETAVRLHLQPKDLGQVLVQLKMVNGEITVQMLAETAKGQALIQEHLPQLKTAFNAQGLTADHLDVAMGNDASAFNTPRRQHADTWSSRASRNNITVDEPAPLNRTHHSSPSRGAGRVDYQA